MKCFRIAMCLAVLASLSASALSKLIVRVDGKVVEFQGTQPRMLTGRVMVPLRGVFEAIGAYVEYTPDMRRIVARKQNEEVELLIGDKVAKKNGTEIVIDAAPIEVRGRVLVPLRFLAESMGAKVKFDADNNVVDISTAGQ